MDYHRRSIRLDGYDYSQKGWYFVTICVQDRMCFFGNIVDGKMKSNVVGEMIQREWVNIPSRFVHVKLGAFVVMPNHFHGMIKINNCVGAGSSRPQNNNNENNQIENCNLSIGREDPAPTLGNIIGYFKYQTTKEYSKMIGYYHFKLWQRNYWEHIIQDEKDHYFHEEYIKNNPVNWEKDKLFIM